MPAFFINSTEIHEKHITLTGDLCHHLQASLRVTLGEILWLTDERRRRYRVEVSEQTKQSLTVSILDQQEAPSAAGPALLLVQAILKGDHMDWVVQKASELGVQTIVPLVARHGVVRPQPDRIAAQRARWQRIAVEAAQQSEQWQPPQVTDPVEWRTYLAALPAPCSLILTERREAMALHRMRLPEDPMQSLALIIGPEGGWSEEEASLAVGAGCQAVGLGPMILRAETAALAAVSIVQSRLGRLG